MSVLLDVDSSIVENNLRIIPDAEDLNKYLSQSNVYPSKLVKPSPGFCLKGRDTAGEKVFINFCHTEAIPPPEDITVADLEKLLLSDDCANYRVPLSIGEIRNDTDAKGAAAVRVCDVACATSFFRKVEADDKFKNFLINVVAQAVSEKYKIEIDETTFVLLKNKKAFGNIAHHRIQNREMAEKMGLKPPTIDEPKKPLIETLSSVEYKLKTPEYRLFKKKDAKNCLIGEFKFPDVISASELCVDVGEDRIIVESKERNYLFDEFVPCYIRQDHCTSTYDKATKVLTITMPLMGG